ncbi:hypothetical protein A3860_12780 [Niastella vici]|uniref:Iron dicitrate transport regulator FecR n=1 Tax=Niastella vici TaxID=1703345 RepID=A0A1V9G6U6_9BACT|nr:FecR family protein [Niastella vici]OQP66369.1 hypothetical protein A3860_12780 [Niastella vici]
MSIQNDRLQYLVNQYLSDKSTPEELQEFWQHIRDLKDESPMQEALQNLWTQSQAGNDTPAIGWQPVLQQVYARANAAEATEKVVPLHKRSIIRWVAAAVVILSVGMAGYWLLNKPSGSAKIVETGTTNKQDVAAPQNNRATITLGNGKTIYLDSAASGSLATEGNVQLVKLADGQIAYNGSANEIVYNTLTNPMGSKVIDMKLSDGSHIWLNAGSSITYPVAFVGNERKVDISGEVYFEVAHNAAMPFRVHHGAMEVQVLGTHFNINAYDDEPAIKVTLLEGSVKVSSMVNGQSSMLKPGEQAALSQSSQLSQPIPVQTEQVMAWKNGLFSFTSADLKTVMRQLSRWYNIQVKYEGEIPVRKFSGEITHDLTLSQLMNGLQSLGIKFSIEGRTMIVRQK